MNSRMPDAMAAKVCVAKLYHSVATLTQLIGGSDSNRQFHSSPPSRPIQSCPVVVPK